MDNDSNTDELLKRAGRGDDEAKSKLLERHRPRLMQFVSVRMNPKLAGRLDASDVVQDVLLDATRHFGGYLEEKPLPFYLWLRGLAWERLAKLHRFHVHARKRSVSREELMRSWLPDDSVNALARQFAADTTSPSNYLLRKELLARVREALERLGTNDREVLVLRCLEQLSTRETAGVLNLTEGAVKSRLMRAIIRLRTLLDETGG